MIPVQQGNSYPPFVKCSDLKKGTIATIEGEFAPPESPKIQSPFIGNINIGSITHTLGINWSTYRSLAPIYGVDTKDWVGKKIEFLGMKTLGKGKGYLWVVHEEVK